jgi:hypothetical protein
MKELGLFFWGGGGGGGGEKYDEERGQIGLKTSYIFQYRFKE